MVGIYKITNTINNKIYIGRSIDVELRMKDHFSNRKRTHGDLDRDIQQYGRDAFQCEIIQECDESQLNDLEDYFILYYKSNDPKLGYNLKRGTPKTYAQKRKVIDLDSKVIYNSTADCAKELNISQGDIVRVCNHLHGSVKGYRFSYYDDYQKNGDVTYIPLAHGTKKKPVKCIETGRVFESAHEAGRQMDLNYRLISSVCNGKRKATGGYSFIYV